MVLTEAAYNNDAPDAGQQLVRDFSLLFAVYVESCNSAGSGP